MITVNITKAKTIAHEIRREARAREFAPHDEIIAKQIPGSDAVAVETSRKAIRDKYATIQAQIDASKTVSELTAIIGANRDFPTGT